MSTATWARIRTFTGALALGAAACAVGGCTSSTTQASGSPTQNSTAQTSSASSAAAAGGASQSTSSQSSAGAGSTASAGASGSGGAGGSGGTAAAPACANGQLKVTLGALDGGDGHRDHVVVFTNAGTVSCSIEGYPGAGVTAADGKTVVLNATRKLEGYMGGGYSNPAPIVLAPEATASTVIEWLGAPINGQPMTGANCPGMNGGKLLITPPNTTEAQAFAAPKDICADADFEVHPLLPGSSGRTS